MHHIFNRGAVALAEVENFFIWYRHWDILECHSGDIFQDSLDSDLVVLELVGGLGSGQEGSHIYFRLELQLPGVIPTSGEVKEEAFFRIDFKDIKQEFSKVIKFKVWY